MNPEEFSNVARAESSYWWYRGMRRISETVLETGLNGRDPVRALEAGCGTGYYAHLLERRRNWSVYPVDLAWEGVVRARGLGLARVTQADLRALPFADGAFDLVSCMDVLVHFAKGGEGPPLAELARVTAPRGLLLLRAAAMRILRSRHSQFVWERQRYERRTLVAAVRQAGFRVLRCTYANCLLSPVALVKFRIWEPLLRRRAESGTKPLPRWLDALLYSCLRAEAGWLRTGRDLPFGQSLVLLGERAAP